MSRPALARVDRILIGILLLGALLAALLHWLLAAPEKTGGMAFQPSTYFNVGTGAKAAYEVLGQLQYRVTRLRRRISPETLREIGVLFILRPSQGLAPEELEALEDWVEDGHALVLVPGAKSDLEPSDHPASHDNHALDDWFAWKESDQPRKDAQGLPVYERAARPEKVSADDRLMAGIRELAIPEGRRFDPRSPCRGPLEGDPVRIFWKDEKGAIGLAVELGGGAVIALADDYPLTNLGLGNGDNGLLVANLVREMSATYPGKVAFDEFHLGFAAHDISPLAIGKLFLAGPWRWAAIQAALICLLALFARAVRFGSPKGVVQIVRRQQREFAEAAGRLFQEAGAAALAAATIYRYYRERISKRLALDLQVEDQRLCQAVEARLGPAAAADLRQAQEAMHRLVNRHRLLAIAQKLHRIAEALEHGH